MELKRSVAAQFDDAILAHVNWILRFRHLLSGIEREAVDPAQVGDDTACAFGRWLHASPDAFRSGGQFELVRTLHREFHGEASAIAAALRAHEPRGQLEARLGDLEGLSDRLIDALYVAKAAHLDGAARGSD